MNRYLIYCISLATIFFASSSCEDILFEEELTDKEVILVAPSENTILTDSVVNFSWETVSGASSYQLQIATPDFTTPTAIELDTITLDTLNTSLQQIRSTLDNGTYEWRVRALNASSQTEFTASQFSVMSETFEQDISEVAVELVAPSEAAILDIREINFAWEQVEFAESYTIQIATPNFTNPIQVLVNESLMETNATFELDNGTYQWRVRASNTTSETDYTTRNFSVDAPTFNQDISDETVTIVAPPEGTVLGTPEINFTWEEVQFAEDYQLQIATPNFENPTQVLVNEILAGTSTTQTLEDGMYQWRVRARNSSSQTGYTTTAFSVTINNDEDISSQSVTLIAPSEGSEVTSDPITFTWQSINNAESYQLQVATPDFENPVQVVVDENFTGTSSTHSLANGAYQWRVRGINQISQTEYSTQSFTVANEVDFSDREVLIISPPNNFIGNTNELNLQWQVVEDASLYRIQLLDQNNTVLDEETTASNSIAYTFPEGTFIWQVRAETSSQSTQYTAQNITIDSQAPNTPNLLSPPDTTTLNTTEVTFTWERVFMGGTPEQDSIFIYEDPGLTTLVLEEEVSNGSFTTALANNNTYYWFMNTTDAANNTSADSPVFSFTVDE